jgi:hypothetical protein
LVTDLLLLAVPLDRFRVPLPVLRIRPVNPPSAVETPAR